MFKASNRSLPCNVQSQLSKNEDVHRYDTRIKGELHISSAKSNLKHMSTNIRGVKVWNKLDVNIRNSATLNVFKRKLKRNMLSSY